jgi:M6 family metalloprotease-like protein
MKHLYKAFFSTLFTLALMVIAFLSKAQNISNCSASPYPINITQADGTVLTVIGKGTLSKSWTETIDGYTVVKVNGHYEYATKAAGKLVATGIQARNLRERKPVELNFLKKQTKSLSPDQTITQNGVANVAGEPDSGPAKAGFASKGNPKAILLLIKYPDLPSTNTITDFNNLMNQANYRGTGSFKDFFSTSSLGQLNITTDVFGWYTAAHPYAYYGTVNGDARATYLVREAVDAAEAAGVDFSKYDNDKDGVVDGIIIAHAGPGAEEGSQTQYIWSHRWVLSATGMQVSYDGVLINDYIINPERRLFTGAMTGRGVFCHEFGHNLGLPDLYDTDGGSEGLGEWSLMASANWLGNEHTPGNMCAWCRAKLNWTTPTTLNANGTYQLDAASTSGQVYRINTPVTNEYFLLENRQKTGLDISLKGSGLAVFHINTNKTNLFPGSNTVNADENLKGVDLEEADGLNDLDRQVNRADAGDLYPGTSNNRTFGESSNPNSKTYNNASSRITVNSIAIDAAGTASFGLEFANLLPSVTITSPFNGQVFTAPATINIAATATDADGSVSKVEFFQGTTKLGEALSAPYQYTWSGVTAGTYNITAKATDNLGGSTTSPATAVVVNNPSCTPPTFVNNGLIVLDATCANNDGNINIIPTSGTAPFMYSINGGFTYVTGPNAGRGFQNLPSGTYKLRLKDATGCESAIVEREVRLICTTPCTPPTFVNNGLIVLDATCANNDGNINIIPTSGTAPFMYSINGGVTYVPGPNAGYGFQNLRSGTYFLRLKDAKGCESAIVEKQVKLICASSCTPPTFVNNGLIVLDASCGKSDGSISIIPTSGIAPFMYSINGGATYVAGPNAGYGFQNLAAGTYQLRLKDSRGCESAIVERTVRNYYNCPGTVSTNPSETSLALSNKDVIATYPNPNSGQFKLLLQNFASQKAEVSIFDAKGTLIQKRSLNLTQNTIADFDIKGKAAGLYLIKVVTASGIKNMKVFVQ